MTPNKARETKDAIKGRRSLEGTINAAPTSPKTQLTRNTSVLWIVPR